MIVIQPFPDDNITDAIELIWNCFWSLLRLIIVVKERKLLKIIFMIKNRLIN